MPTKPISDELLRETLEVYDRCDRIKTHTAKRLGVSPVTVGDRLRVAEQRGITLDKPFDIDNLPEDQPPVEELWQRRKTEFNRRKRAEDARKLIQVRVKIDGPIGIVHMGDPHVDDPGTNAELLLDHCEIIRNTEGLFGANVGDNQNLWVGRLARLYGEQETTKAQAWALTEDFVRRVRWLYILAGNHDVWADGNDPLKWMLRHQQGVYEYHGARLNLNFPNGKQVRINARHDFRGHSMWNPSHGVAKAAQMGWRDHILTCGHKHVSGYQPLKCPATGLISHAMRVAGYKQYDYYGQREMGLPDQNISPAFTTIIDPQYDDDDPRLISVKFDVQDAADYLTYRRRAA